ncbi:MAG: hypothetical protein LBS06_05585, partial [Treponema sp.]|nr:hypothetical protein [Treponema sp.]
MKFRSFVRDGPRSSWFFPLFHIFPYRFSAVQKTAVHKKRFNGIQAGAPDHGLVIKPGKFDQPVCQAEREYGFFNFLQNFFQREGKIARKIYS